jgi:hypothetical protein
MTRSAFFLHRSDDDAFFGFHASPTEYIAIWRIAPLTGPKFSMIDLDTATRVCLSYGVISFSMSSKRVGCHGLEDELRSLP